MTPLRDRHFDRILIIKPSSPGDIIHALPVLRALRRRFPKAHIAWLVATPFADLLSADPDLNELIRFDRHHFGRIGRSPAVSAEFLRFIRGLRARRFDLVVDLQGLFRSGFLARSSGAPVRIGFARARELAWMFYTDRVAVPDPDAHAVDRNLRLAAELGAAADAPAFALAIPDDDRRAAAALLASAGFAPGADYAVLVPATRWETKCWPAERFGRLARQIADRAALRSVLVGGESDASAARIAADAADGAAADLCGKTSLRQLAAVIAAARLVITADSTPMHLAAALGRPLVALFGPTNPRRTGPYGRLGDVLHIDLDCSPCYIRRLRHCPYEHACMQQLTADRVLAAALERLAASTCPTTH